MDQPTQVSTGTDGTPADGYSKFGVRQSFSADGTKFVFVSSASNLVEGDTTGTMDIFVKDMVNGAVTRVPIATNQHIATDTDNVSISADGTKIVFSSRLDNLVAGDTDGKSDVFVKDLASGELTRISNTVGGAAADSYNPTFSPDGTKVLFETTNVVNSSPYSEVYIKDLSTGSLSLVSTSISGATGNRGDSGFAVFSQDGTKVAFLSSDTDLASGDTNGFRDIFVKDLTTGQITRVSTDGNGNQASNANGGFAFSSPTFSPDGTKLLFATSLTLIPGEEHKTGAIYSKDLNTNAVQLIAVVDDYAVFSPDGENVLYISSASDLPSNPSDNPNHFSSAIYVKNIASGNVTRVAFTHGDSPAIFSPDGSKILFESIDSEGRVEIYTVPFEVAPRSHDDMYKGGYDAALTVDATHGVLANDGDANSDALTAALVSGPAHGTVKLKADGSFIYTPDGTYVGNETFVYHAFDGTKYGKDATVTINVTGNIERIDTTSDGSQATSGAGSYMPVFSPDGKYVAFQTASTNLVPHDGSGYSQIVLKNIETGEISVVSSLQSGGHSDNAQWPVFSADGTKIAFSSGDYGSNPHSQIVVKDLAKGTFTVISTSQAGVEGNGISSTPQFSADGSKIVFTSASKNLVDGDANDQPDIFVKDLKTGAVTLVSAAQDGTQTDDYSALASFSPDGKSVVFVSAADNLVAGDNNARADIFLKNLTTGAVTLVSSSADGTFGNGNSDAPVFSPDGTMVAFTSASTNLTSGNANDIEIFVKNLVTGEVKLVSTNANGVPADFGAGQSSSLYPVFSPDGTRIAFYSNANNLVPGAKNTNGGVYEKNLMTGAIRLVSSDSFENEGSNYSARPSYSPDGKKIAFYSTDSSFVPGDTNNAGDIFIKDLTKFPINSGKNNTPPVANADGYTTVEGDPLHVTKAKGVLANDSDAQNDQLTAALVKGPAHGELTFNANGSFDYTPDAGYHATDGFTYRASDGTDKSGTTKVTLTITLDPTVRSSVTATLDADHTNLILTGSKAINGTGNGLANTLTGNGNDNVLNGRAGADTMKGGNGDDTYVVDNKGDKVVEDKGEGHDLVRSSIAYTLGANVEDLVLTGAKAINATGSSLANKLIGNSGNNVLDGKLGNDTLTGAGGADILSGGTGSDRFIFKALGDSTVAASGHDTITDFVHGTDTIDLHTIDADSRARGDQAFRFIGAQDFHHKADELHLVRTAGDTVLQGDVNGDGKADFAITLIGHVNLNSGDFAL